ncbi:MAG: hypothetical protein WBP57_10110 [Ignavibacteria bacterium]
MFWALGERCAVCGAGCPAGCAWRGPAFGVDCKHDNKGARVVNRAFLYLAKRQSGGQAQKLAIREKPKFWALAVLWV